MTVIVLLILTISITAFSLTREEAESPTLEPMMEYSPADEQLPIDFESFSFKIEEEVGIESRAAIVINRSTGNTICYKNPDAELPPASLTKAMTVLVALENVTDPHMTVHVTGNSAERFVIGAALLNVLLLFMRSRNWMSYSPGQVIRRQKFRRSVNEGKKSAAGPQSLHRCAICGRTEKDDDTLEFRYCTKCEGGLEYCQDHLFIHTHVKKGEPPHMMKM